MTAHRMRMDRALTDQWQPLESRVKTQYDIASSTTLADVKDSNKQGLVCFVEQSKHYRFKAHLFLTVGATGGANVAIGGSNTSPTAFAAAIKFVDFTTPAVTGARVTAIGTGATAAGQTSYEVEIEGYIKPSADTTLTVQFAQKVSNGTNSSVLAGSWLMVHEIPQQFGS